MFDVAPTEFLLVAVVALLVIGPKDLPKAMRVIGYWVGRMRGVARQFRSGFDNMVREAELEEMEKRWAEENARIMREHPNAGPQTGSDFVPVYDVTSPSVSEPTPPQVGADGHSTAHDPFAVQPDPSPGRDLLPGDVSEPVLVEKPEVRPSSGESHPPSNAGVNS